MEHTGNILRSYTCSDRFKLGPPLVHHEVVVFEMLFTHADIFGDGEILSVFFVSPRFQSWIFGKKEFDTVLSDFLLDTQRPVALRKKAHLRGIKQAKVPIR